jgi:uncharacterized repeat protein (TIGR01451 family)
MKRKLVAFTMTLTLILNVLFVANVGAHTVTVGDSYRGDWFAKTPSAKDIGTIARDASERGEYVWSDTKGDNLSVPGFTSDITREADLEQFTITADANNIYFLAKMEYIRNLNLSRVPEVMISIDADHAAGNVQLPATAGISVTNEAAWEYVIQTKFTNTTPTAAPQLWKPAASTCSGCAAQLTPSNTPYPGSFIEISVPWSNFTGGKPAPQTFWRFTVSVYYDNFAKPDSPRPSAVIDALSAKQTADEVADGDLDNYVDVHFADNGEVFSPILITELLPYPQYGGPGADPAGEWIELHNILPATCGSACNIDLLNYKIGTQPYRGASGGAMLTFATSRILPPGDFAVIVHDDSGSLTRFTTQYPTVPLSKIIKMSSLQPYVPSYAGTPWAPDSTISLVRQKSDAQSQFVDFKETLALLNQSDVIADLVQYGTTGATMYDANNAPIIVPLTGVTANESFERCPSERDTNDASFDFRAHDPATGNDPTPATTCPFTPGIDLQIRKTARNGDVVLGGVVTYTLNWDSIGQGSVSNVVVTDTLPSAITFGSATPAPSSINGQTLTWNLGPAGTNVRGTILLSGTLGTNVGASQIIVNTARIRSGNPFDVDLHPDDNVASASVTAQMPDLRVSSEGWPTRADPGSVFCYDINYVYGFGGAIGEATNVVISDALPPGLILVNQSSSPSLPYNGAVSGTLVWGPTTVPVDGTGTIHLCLQVRTDVMGGQVVSNRITITGTPDSDTTAGSNNVETRPLTFGYRLYIPLIIK